MKILFNPFEDAEILVQKRGGWVVGVIETRLFWPKKKQVVHFDKKIFILLPLEQNSGTSIPTLPAIAINATSFRLSTEDARREILRFASVLSWRERGKIEVVMWTGGNIPRSSGLLRNNTITDYFDTEYLPIPTSDNAKKALAFYREGISLDNPFYSFLSFYKAFCVAVPTVKNRSKWMKTKRDMLDDRDALERLAEIEKTGKEVSSYLYLECRHAIAHSDKDPLVNPDNLDDRSRLTKDRPLIRNFTELAIEEELGIKRRSTIYREHLYELEGFREIIPRRIVRNLENGRSISSGTGLDLPDNILLLAKRGHDQCPLENMSVANAAWIEGGLILDFKSATATIKLRVILNLIDEKLHFDPISHFVITQNRANKKCIQEELAATHFKLCILSNGHLEIWDTKSEKRLGCTDVYIPLNSRIDIEFFNKEIATLEKLLSSN